MPSTNYLDLPDEEEHARRTVNNRFEDIYGKDTGMSAESLYLAQEGNFTRFAKVYPRIAFLLQQLQLIYENIDTCLDIFKMNYGVADQNNSLSQQSVRFKDFDPFGYFSSEGIEYEHRSCLLHFRAALEKWSEGPFGPIFREVACDIIHEARSPKRNAIVEELVSREVAAELNRLPVSKDAGIPGIWAVRRDIARQEEMLAHSLQRINQALDRHEKSNQDILEYGHEPVAHREPNHVSERRHPSPERRRHSPRRSNRSLSQGSVNSSRAAPSLASVTTWAPEEPDLGTLSIKVWSETREDWVESLAVMDTGCEGGNFVSSAFLSEHLEMNDHVIKNDDAHRVQWVDIGGKTDFKPSGMVQLRWYGRDIQTGRRGKRSEESSSWFHVAPHLASDTGEQPFQILLGKEFLHENEVIQYRGLRLYKSKNKKTNGQLQEEQVETLRRQQQRQDLELRQRARRVPIDGSPTVSPTFTTRNSDDISLRSQALSSNGDSSMTVSTIGD